MSWQKNLNLNFCNAKFWFQWNEFGNHLSWSTYVCVLMSLTGIVFVIKIVHYFRRCRKNITISRLSTLVRVFGILAILAVPGYWMFWTFVPCPPKKLWLPICLFVHLDYSCSFQEKKKTFPPMICILYIHIYIIIDTT